MRTGGFAALGRRLVGALPAGWKAIELDAVTKAPIIYGILQPGEDLPGGVPYVRPTEYTNGPIRVDSLRRTSPEIAARYKRSTLKGGDLLISIVGTIGRIAVVPDELEGGNITQSSARLRLNSELIDRRYAYWILLSPALQKQYDRYRLGTGVPRLNIEHVRELIVPLPPLDEQRRIAGILDQADAIRRKRQEAIRLTEDFLRSAFLDMFGDPVTNPKGWCTQRLESVAEVGSGVTKGRKLNAKQTVSVPYMRVANVQDGHIDLDDVQTIDVLPADILKYALKVGDLLLTEGGDPDKLGRGAVWCGAIEPCIHQNHIFRVRCTTDGVLPEYLSALIGSAYGKRFFLRAAKQTTGIATVNKTELRSFPVLLPPVELQQKYDQLVHRFGEVRMKYELAAAATNDLYGSLVQRAFRGEL